MSLLTLFLLQKVFVNYVEQLQTQVIFSQAPTVLCISTKNDNFPLEEEAHWTHLLLSRIPPLRKYLKLERDEHW